MKIKVDVDGDKIQLILDALMDKHGVLVNAREVVEDLLEAEINLLAFTIAYSGPDSAHVRSLADRLREKDNEDGI